jgi:hypothetical protein
MLELTRLISALIPDIASVFIGPYLHRPGLDPHLRMGDSDGPSGVVPGLRFEVIHSRTNRRHATIEASECGNGRFHPRPHGKAHDEVIQFLD